MMDSTTLHYLFSAIAQSAAAFVAFVAVFAIFRLQANNNDIEEEYKEARQWLIQKQAGGPDIYNKILSLPKKTIKEELNKMAEKNQPAYGEEVKNILTSIIKSEDYSRKFVYNASRPLKKWAYVFFFSLVALGGTSNSRIWGTLAALLGLIYIAWTLFDTKIFIQESLNLQQKTNDST